MESVRLCSVGSGVIVRSVLDNVRDVDGISLEAVYSRTREKAEALAESYGASRVYTSFTSMLGDDFVNTVYIATPNLLHYEQAKLALMAGKNVICEKPLVTRRVHAQELRDIAREKGLFLFEAAPTVFLPNFRVLREKLSLIGRVRLVMSNYSQYSSRYDSLLRGERPNIFSLEYAGGALMDINYYNVILNTALFGLPESAEYFPNIFPAPGLADTSGVLVMKYDGFVSTNAGAKDTWGINHFTIEGEGGYIRADESNGLKSIRVVTRESDETFNLQDKDRWHYEIREIARMMVNGEHDAAMTLLDDVVGRTGLVETVRRKAGIIFPGDE